MAAMMFPAIIPMVLLYNRIISSNQNNKNGSNLSLVSDFNKNTDNLEKKEKRQFFNSIPTFSIRAIKTSGFIGTYLLVWALTGILLLILWSIIMNNLLVGYNTKDFAIVSGILLIVSGIYQFSPLKERCLGYCESPLSFFMKRWKGNQLTDGLKMGMYHGMYCLGCCWPYFLLMIALGWMNILWMGLFAAIIFAEKVWQRGIWVARGTGIVFIIVGFLSIIGVIPIVMEDEGSVSHSNMNNMLMEDMGQDIDGKDGSVMIEMSNDDMN